MDVGSLLGRSWKATTTLVGHDVMLGLAGTLVFTGLGALITRTTPWTFVFMLNVVTPVVIGVAVYAFSLLRFATHRSEHEDWAAAPPALWPPDNIQFAIGSRKGGNITIPNFGLRCAVTDPDGHRWWSGEFPGSTVGVSARWFNVPANFAGAPPAVSGSYIVLWQERDKRRPDKWHELLRIRQAAEVPVALNAS